MNKKQVTEASPPRLFLRFLEWFCPPELYEGVEGDLLEQFDTDVDKHGVRIARRKFMWNVIRFCRPGIFLRNKFSFHLINTVMIENYITVASRNLAKRKLYSFINALGLSIGMAFCILIYLFIVDEKSFDQFHTNKDRIYRMHGIEYSDARAKDPKADGPFEKLAFMQIGLAPAMKAELPEVEYATHFCSRTSIVRHEDKVFRESFVYVDADFFKMFSFPLLKGNRDKIFATVDEVVLTPAMAEKYFGDKDPIGEMITLDDKLLTITGVMEAPPANSSLNFQMLVPITGWGGYNDHNLSNWINQGFPTFVQLHASANEIGFKAKLDQLTERYMGDLLKQWRERNKVPKEYKPYEIGFTKLTDIHFQKEVGWDKVSDRQYSWILGGIAVLILLIACINYISLALTTSARRRMEVGIRKVIGAHKRQLVYQFCFESVMLALISMVIGIGLVVLFLPAFNQFTGKEIDLHVQDLLILVGVGATLALTVGLLAGSYPALFLSRFRPAQVLRGGFTARLQAGFTRPLVVLQFAVSAFLIISSVIMYRQMHFVTTKDLGYDQHQVVIIATQTGRGDTVNVSERFRQKALSGNLSVSAVTATNYPFAIGDYMVYGFRDGEEGKTAYGYTVDPYFVRTMGIQVLKGRDFDASNPADEHKTVVVNEAMVKYMKWQDPVGERLMIGRDTLGLRVIGVVKDFHFLSLQEDINPMFLTIDQHFGKMDYILARISPDNIPATLEQIRKDFAEVAPNRPFEYSFMDDNIAKQYASFQRWTGIMGLSTGFAILISCLGLFGLAGINAVNRTREVGIRKVMGAGLRDIFILLNKQFAWLSVIAFVLAAPLSWYAMQQWLDSFRFHITVGWELIGVSMLAGLVVALATVSYHALKAASVNPADTLKYE